MKNLSFIISITLLFTLLSCEETSIEIEKYGSIKGLVVDVENNPLAGVSITTSPASSATITDSSGIFRIFKVIEGDVAITARKSDFLSNSISVAVYDKDTTESTFYLMKDENDVGWIDIFDPVPD